MLTCGWPPNTTYIEVWARERHRVKLIGISNKAIHSYYLFLRKATFRLRWPAGKGRQGLLLLSGM